MKKGSIILISLLGILHLYVQESISINNKTLSGHEAQDEFWIFSDSEDTIVAMHYSEYIALYRKARLAQLDAQRLDSILSAKEDLLEKYEEYELDADRHIAVQNEAIAIADSLYSGYKSLYSDLKTLYDVRPFCLVAGMGLYSYREKGLDPLIHIGVEYRKLQLSGQFGKSYRGVNLQYRIPIF